MPKYKSIADAIRHRIADATYSPENPIPDQETLADEFDVSRMTIQKALGLLTAEGLIYSNKRSGTYVRKFPKINDRDGIVLNLSGPDLLDGLVRQGADIQQRILHFEVRYARDTETEPLNMKGNELIYDIQLLRLLDEEPIELRDTLMPFDLVPGLKHDMMNESVYTYIQDTLGKHIGSAVRSFRVAKANEESQRFLQLDPEALTIMMKQIVSFPDGTPFELTHSYYPNDKMKMEMFVSSFNWN
ncbi:GntR family transcriptional regulator [Lacticaseibacillus jixianensis]|uniref:GntR family transcriptional regulator n=1 Tax=Lacticaseibacillus jixianensis TaxID=2486012 RepID=A0ABW4BD71_9LACO|nr:GntR family transcriptional regulator [Lacticaseibacillus jixianensis]